MGESDKRKGLQLLALGLAVCSIAAFSTFAPTCPALVIDTGRHTIDVGLSKDYVSFMQEQKNRLGPLPTVSDWSPWLQLYPIAVMATVTFPVIILLLSSVLVRGTDTGRLAIAACATLVWAGSLAAAVYYLRLVSYSNQNSTTTCNVEAGYCASTVLLGSAFTAQLVLLLYNSWDGGLPGM